MGDSAPGVRWPVAAGAVLLVLLVVLASGVVLARRVQTADVEHVAIASPQPTGLMPRPLAAGAAAGATVTLAATATPAPVAVSAAAAATVGPATSSVAAVGGATSTPGVSATDASDASFSIVLVNGTPRVLAAGATPVATPVEWWNQTDSVAPALAAELNAAYSHFWDVRAQALLSLDPSSLPEVLDGSALQREQAGLETLRAHNMAEQIDVQHHIQIVHATSNEATVFDNYTSRIVPVDLTTNQPRPSAPAGTWYLAYHFRKLNGTWKVVEAVQINS